MSKSFSKWLSWDSTLNQRTDKTDKRPQTETSVSGVSGATASLKLFDNGDLSGDAQIYRRLCQAISKVSEAYNVAELNGIQLPDDPENPKCVETVETWERNCLNYIEVQFRKGVKK